jgi:type VI protein secretion system component VasK
MAIGNMDLYKALKEAGASEESALEAAKSVAGQLPRFWAFSGTLAVLVALVLGLLWLQMGTVERLAGIEQRLTSLEQRDAQQHTEIMQQLEALRRERGGGQP